VLLLSGVRFVCDFLIFGCPYLQFLAKTVNLSRRAKKRKKEKKKASNMLQISIFGGERILFSIIFVKIFSFLSSVQ